MTLPCATGSWRCSCGRRSAWWTMRKGFRRSRRLIWPTPSRSSLSLAIRAGRPASRKPPPRNGDAEYRANNEVIFLCSLGAAIQNIKLGVAAESLTSAWLSGGGEDKTKHELAEVLGYPTWMKAYGTMPIGYPAVDPNRRYRRPLGPLLPGHGCQPRQYRTRALS